MTAAPLLVGCALHDGADIDACGCPALDSPGAIAYRGLLVKARAEIARLTAELDAAREAAQRDRDVAQSMAKAAHDAEEQLAAARAVAVDVCRYLDCSESDLLAVVTSLYETRARAIRDATDKRDAEWEKRIPPACLRRIAHDLDDCPDYCETCAVQSAARGTVGGLLATAPVEKVTP